MDMSTKTNTPQDLEQERERLGISRSEAADLLGCGREAIWKVERKARQGPVRGALQFLLAVMPELDAIARERVVARLKCLRPDDNEV